MIASSTLLLDEYFEAGEDRFLDQLLESRADGKLTHFAERWYRDRRPWARAALLEYVDDGCDRPGHKGLVKRLLRLAEAHDDDELMMHFLVAFDRLITHRLAHRRRWHWQERCWVEGPTLVSTGTHRYSLLWGMKSDRFTTRTRQHLQRRATRYLRAIGRKDERRYRRALLLALSLYREQALSRPEQILDAWSLLHLLHARSPVLRWGDRTVRIAAGRKLSELAPHPLYPGALQGCLDELLDLLQKAPALFVRRFIVRWLEVVYAAELDGLDVKLLRALLASPYPDVQLFGAERLKTARGLETLPVSAWLDLLGLDHPVAIALICEQVARCVSPERLSLDQCLALARAKQAPVAELGLEWAMAKTVEDEDLLRVAALRHAPCATVRRRGIAWLLELLERDGQVDVLRELIDARQEDVRALALPAIGRIDRFRDDLRIWTALVESPYPDARAFLLSHLADRLERLDPSSVVHLWATTLLDVHRGSRAKRRALLQIARAVATAPERADELLPLLAMAMRSVRPAERRAALGAVGRAAFANAALRGSIERHVPELRLFDEGPT